ncbi:partner and localizer of BRCA2 [Alosa sapidissima]|uniref:partner and localizer of BRCA2 n=1 Tax=Alosa sapidissima TaxID=34773 RepID=UPI001C08BBC1|nr:partner and localizer of BRCA2 [Alosa sapidissima]
MCVCVAGEWSVCVWTEDSPRHWSLSHTWRFTQSVVSLFSVPDSDGLLCVTLGQLEITETSVLSTGSFSQSTVCGGACLRTVVGVSNSRIACGHAPKPRQTIEVHTLTKEGSIGEPVRLVSSDWCIESLVAVENQSDALIGWTDSSALIIWNTRTGHLLQTIELGHMVSMATCLRGYSCKGLLCALLQRVCVSGGRSQCVFTLIGLNPMNGKAAELTTVNTHSSERFVELDVIGSDVVGVSPSGRMVLWDVSGGGACLLASDDCHLARWAGPNTLLTGHKNGDVCVYQYYPL